eukprot:7376336-Prymnesium_polylepis.1
MCERDVIWSARDGACRRARRARIRKRKLKIVRTERGSARAVERGGGACAGAGPHPGRDRLDERNSRVTGLRIVDVNGKPRQQEPGPCLESPCEHCGPPL